MDRCIIYYQDNNSATYSLTNADGCDSIVTLVLDLNNSSTSTDYLTTCDSLTWIDGITCYQSNNSATHTIPNIENCDSVITLNLLVNNSSVAM